jgi:hypothetical protein
VSHFIGAASLGASPSRRRFRLAQSPVQERARSPAVDRVRADEPIELAAVADPELRAVQASHLAEFAGNRFIRRDAVEMPAFDQEPSRGDQGGHLCVVEGAAQVELDNLVLGLMLIGVLKSAFANLDATGRPG